jgi:hypothetical protein
MIRVNLLRNRKEGLQALVNEPGGASSFISGREVLLAAVFLVLGGAILWFVLGDQAGSDPAVASGNIEASSNAPEPAANPTPTAASASGTPRAAVSLPPSPTSGRAAVSVTTPTAPPPASTPQVASTTQAAVPQPGPALPRPARSSAVPPAPPGTAGGPRGSTLLSGRSAAAPPAASSAASGAAPVVPAGRSSGRVITMRELRILGQGNALQIIAAMDGEPEYKMFRVNNPDRVVIDLPGVRHEIGREYREQGLSNSIVRTVRVAQNQIEPPMVRLVLEVEAFPELQILSRPDGLLINVSGK